MLKNRLLEIFEWNINIDVLAINHCLYKLMLKVTWPGRIMWQATRKAPQYPVPCARQTETEPPFVVEWRLLHSFQYGLLYAHRTQSSSQSNITTSVFLNEWWVSLQCKYIAETWALLVPLRRCWSRQVRRDCLVSILQKLDDLKLYLLIWLISSLPFYNSLSTLCCLLLGWAVSWQCLVSELNHLH